MNKYILILALCAIAAVSCKSNAQKQEEHTAALKAELLARMQSKENPYNLNILNTVEEYLEITAKDTLNRLVNLEGYIPNVILDIRYATDNNFTGTQVYTMPRAYLVRPAARALKIVADSLAKLGLGIVIYDGYRPYSATVYFKEVYSDTTFVASPRTGSNHNRGSAVDLTLYHLADSTYCLMPSEFDTFSEKASWKCMDLPDEAIRNRQLLGDLMESVGFSKYEDEWWHYNFDYSHKEIYTLKNIFFEELEVLADY